VIRRRAGLLVALALILVSSTAVARVQRTTPGAAEIQATVVTLTAPEMSGRRTGTVGGDLAAARLAGWLADAGLRPGGDGGTYLQSFVLRAGRSLGPATALEIAGHRLGAGVEWTPHGGTRVGEARGPLLFLGHGATEAEWTVVDARDKVVLVLDGRASRLDKLILARRHGAAALLVVSDVLPTLDATAAAVDVVSGAITTAAADAALAPRTVAGLAQAAERGTPTPLTAVADVRTDIGRVDVHGANVVGVLPGTDPALADEAVVLGAHYDHLGARGGDVYHGADDNASGTAVVLALARAYAAAGGPPRTLVVVFFGAEELGLVGSSHYVKQPAWPLPRTVAMLNFDMVGRLRDGRLTIGGADTGDALRRVLADAIAAVPDVAADVRGTPYSPSDHSRFYAAGAPVLFFHTGTHPDYHRPSDTAEKLDAGGMARIAAVGAHVVDALAGGPRPVFARVPPPSRARDGRGGGPLLGVGWDGREPGDGVHLGHVVPGSAAERAGLRDGDIVVRVGDTPVNTFEELRSAIRARQPGDVVRLVYLRDGRDHVTSATLERSQE
jgi:hypothetical protein